MRYIPYKIWLSLLIFTVILWGGVKKLNGNLSLSLGNTKPTNYNVKLFNPRLGTYTSVTYYAGTNPIILEPPDEQDWVFLLTNRQQSLAIK